jgi:hypothetical protein
MDLKVAAVTFNATEFEVTPLWVALMFADPIPTAVARPLEAIVATAAFEELQVTAAVRFCMLPSLNVPVAVN